MSGVILDFTTLGPALAKVKLPPDVSEAFFEDDTLVIHVRRRDWWFEINGKPSSRIILEAEAAPLREVCEMLSVFDELMLWAVGGRP